MKNTDKANAGSTKIELALNLCDQKFNEALAHLIADGLDPRHASILRVEHNVAQALVRAALNTPHGK